MLAKILPRGQVTLPSALRREAGIKPGDVVIVRQTALDTIELRIVPKMSLDELLERYAIDGPIDEATDRAAWEAAAAADVFGERDG